jgi:hypothetical protein
MTQKHDKKPQRVGEPVQVFLGPADMRRLRTLAAQSGSSKSDVLRRGLAALEREISSPDDNPLFRLIGIIGRDTGTTGDGRDVAREHDAVLADSYESTTTGRTRKKRGRR